MTAPRFELTSERQKVSRLPTEPPGRRADFGNELLIQEVLVHNKQYAVEDFLLVLMCVHVIILYII